MEMKLIAKDVRIYECPECGHWEIVKDWEKTPTECCACPVEEPSIDDTPRVFRDDGSEVDPYETDTPMA